MARGYVPLYKKGKELGVIKKVHGENMIVMIPLKGEKAVSIASYSKDSGMEIFMVRSEAHWFINSHKFSTPKESLYSF